MEEIVLDEGENCQLTEILINTSKQLNIILI